MPSHLYVVFEGDFEIFRKSRQHSTMMDPTQVNTLKTGDSLTPQKILGYLGPSRKMSIAATPKNNSLH